MPTDAVETAPAGQGTPDLITNNTEPVIKDAPAVPDIAGNVDQFQPKEPSASEITTEPAAPAESGLAPAPEVGSQPQTTAAESTPAQAMAGPLRKIIDGLRKIFSPSTSIDRPDSSGLPGRM